MKKILNKKVLISISVILAFILLVFGFTFLIVGAFNENYTLIYVSLGLIVTSILIYSILIIYGICYYLKKRS